MQKSSNGGESDKSSTVRIEIFEGGNTQGEGASGGAGTEADGRSTARSGGGLLGTLGIGNNRVKKAGLAGLRAPE